jgi:hypothetical protein
LAVESSSARGAGKRWRYNELTVDKCLVVGYSWDSNNMSTEAGESSLLEAVARE